MLIMKIIFRTAVSGIAVICLSATAVFGAVAPGQGPVSEVQTEAAAVETPAPAAADNGTAVTQEPAADVSGYQAAERANLQDIIEVFQSRYSSQLDRFDSNVKSNGCRITVQPGETGRALLGLFAPVDMSWVNALSLDIDSGLNNGMTALSGNLFLNDTQILSGSLFVDAAANAIYASVPELSSTWMKWIIPSSDTDYSNITASLEQGKASFPDEETVGKVLERYLGLLIDHIQDSDRRETTLSAGNIQTDCTMYEGRMYYGDLLSAVSDMIETAETDEELKQLIESVPGQEPDLYTSFISQIGEMKNDIAEESADAAENDEYVVSRIFVDEDGHIIGRNLGADDPLEDGSIDETLILSYAGLKSDSDLGTYLTVFDDSGSYLINLNGAGTIDEAGLLNADFRFAGSSFPTLFNVKVSNYDTVSADQGLPRGTFEISPSQQSPEGAADSGSGINLDQFSLKLDFNIEKESSSILADILISGSSVASVSITSGLEAEVPVFDKNAAAGACPMDQPEESDAFVNQLDPSVLLQNLAAAGMPEEFINQLGESGF